MIKNYRKVPLETIPDCCGVCRYGDSDGMGCDTLSEILHDEQPLNVEFNYFHVCDDFERVSQQEFDDYWPNTF